MFRTCEVRKSIFAASSSWEGAKVTEEVLAVRRGRGGCLEESVPSNFAKILCRSAESEGEGWVGVYLLALDDTADKIAARVSKTLVEVEPQLTISLVLASRKASSILLGFCNKTNSLIVGVNPFTKRANRW